MIKRLLILVLSCGGLITQAQDFIEVQAYTVVDTAFERVLNEFYIQEQSYDYYDSLVCSFSINCPQYCHLRKDSCTFVALMSGYGADRTYRIIEDYFANQDTSMMLVKYHNIYIFVENCYNCLRPLFSAEPDTIVISYCKPKIKPRKKKEDLSGEDDSYWPNTWICCKTEDDFIVVQKIEGTLKHK